MYHHHPHQKQGVAMSLNYHTIIQILTAISMHIKELYQISIANLSAKIVSSILLETI